MLKRMNSTTNGTVSNDMFRWVFVEVGDYGTGDKNISNNINSTMLLP